MAEWLTSRSTVPGSRSRVPGADAATTADERADLAATWLGRIRDLVRNDYLSQDEGGRPEGRFAVVSNRVQASRTPMFRDLAVDVRDVVEDLLMIIEQQRRAAARPQAMAYEPVPTPLTPEDRYVIPQLDDESGQF